MANGQQLLAFVLVGARNRSGGTGMPVGLSIAMSKQNDFRRISNECAVDLALLMGHQRAPSLQAAPGIGR